MNSKNKRLNVLEDFNENDNRSNIDIEAIKEAGRSEGFLKRKSDLINKSDLNQKSKKKPGRKPKPGRGQIHPRLSQKLVDKFDQLATKKGLTHGELLEEILLEYFRRT